MRNTRLAGHSLLSEGRLAFNSAGVKVWWHAYPAPPGSGLYGKCSCGALTPPDTASASAARRWHVAHKNEHRPAVTP